MDYLIWLIFFLTANAIFAVVGIVTVYRFLWKKMVGEREEASASNPPSERELALEEEMREMRKMIDMLASAQREPDMDAVFNRRGENTDKVNENAKRS